MSSYGYLYPDTPKFVEIVEKTHGPSLKQCFLDQHLTEAWSALVEVSFTKDGGRSVSARLLHEGAADKTSATAQALENCYLTPIALWPWPKPSFDTLDGGRPYIRFIVGYGWRAN